MKFVFKVILFRNLEFKRNQGSKIQLIFHFKARLSLVLFDSERMVNAMSSIVKELPGK